MASSAQSETARDYFERIKQRMTDSVSREALCCKIWQVAKTAERHWQRSELAGKRYQRAVAANNQIASEYEKEVMLILSYEMLDTVFIALQLLDLDKLNLHSSSDGAGLAGEDANYVFELLQLLENICTRVHDNSTKYGIRVDFLRPVDELEGITFTESGHWHNFDSSSVERSFSLYFTQARRGLNHRLNQIPHFWRKQTMVDVIVRGKYINLRKAIYSLQRAVFPQLTLASLIEKEVVRGSGKLRWQSIPLFKPSKPTPTIIAEHGLKEQRQR